MNDSILGKKLNERLAFVYAYLMKMGASKEDAEDVIQETAYKFLRYMDSIKTTNIQSWLFKVAINQYYDMTRKQTRRKNVWLTFNLEELLEENTPEKQLLQSELGKSIQVVLQKLTPKSRELLLLKYSTGLKITEIAQLYDMKEASIKTSLYRARQQFIEEYGRNEYEQRP
ncbi:sigma-70 family RNA polymerase sigma factor [Bacillus sp. CGMCC 1.16541]|uniref:RNA polymerase sigma factor n=1 Tax=Bacillus sp. CGMCC 1.16541 TaxID=2185143 RepID=UPI000D731472|nr:sigma-70 family RNA polymerase sigma factor [Bacillus sp. CGMCC 1.16541]